MSDTSPSAVTDGRSASADNARPSSETIGQRVRSLRLPPEAKSQRSSGWRAWTLCLVLAVATVWLAWQLSLRPAGTPDSGTAGPPLAAQPVTGDRESAAVSGAPAARAPEPASRAGQSVQLEAKGYIVPAHQILVSPLVSGRIKKLAVIEGARVPRGEVLAELENTEYEADYLRAAAARELAEQRLAELRNGSRPEEKSQAEAELAEAEAQLPQLEAEWQRNKDLRERGTASVLDYERSESAYRAMTRRAERLRSARDLILRGPRQERIDAARAEVRQYQAEERKAQWKLDNCTLRAPLAGTILKKNAEEGNIVNPSAFNGSFSICEMADLSDLEVDLSITERDVAKVFVGQACRVVTEAWKDRVYEGVVSRLMPIADRAKGAVPVRVKVRVAPEEEGVYLKPEMSALVTFLAGQAPAASVPERASPKE